MRRLPLWGAASEVAYVQVNPLPLPDSFARAVRWEPGGPALEVGRLLRLA